MKMSDLNALPWMARWQMLPPPGGTILCAVSGGRDSVCLLHYLHHLGQTHGFAVAAAHLNHLMRPTAQRDEDFVRALCASLDVPFHTEKADVYALCDTWGLTVEETGRRARYDFLRRTASAIHADFIATAHHREDQAETVLLQLLRVTGPQGLSGSPPVRGGIIRRLLDTPRAAIEGYIQAHGLTYVTDETNLDLSYARNRLRLSLWPELETINPVLTAHICHTADILRAENDYLDGEAAALLPPDGTSVPCEAVLSAPPVLRPRMLRLLAARLPVGKKDFTAAHYQALAQLCHTGGALSLPGGAQALCRGGTLTLSVSPVPPDPQPLREGRNTFGPWHITVTRTPAPGALALQDGPLTVRPWRRDDRMTLPGSRGPRSLKRLLSDRGIAPPQRDTWPVLCRDDRPATVWQVGTDTKALPADAGHTIYIIITQNNGG